MGTMGVKNEISPWQWTELPIQPNVKNVALAPLLQKQRLRK